MGRIIKLTKGRIAIVDAADYPLISKYRWQYVKGYAGANIQGQRITMHRFLMSDTRGMYVDHINHQRCDNRRSNLRLITPRDNRLNQSRYKILTHGWPGATKEQVAYAIRFYGLEGVYGQPKMNIDWAAVDAYRTQVHNDLLLAIIADER